MEFTTRLKAYIALFVVVVSTLIIVFLYPDTQSKTTASQSDSSQSVSDEPSKATGSTNTREESTDTTVQTDSQTTPIEIMGDGTPLASNAPEELFAEPTNTIPVDTVENTNNSAPSSTEELSNLGPLDRAEAFVEDYFTYYEIDTPETWKARVSEHVTDSLAEQLSFTDMDEGVGLRAVMEPIEEGLGEVSDVAAEFPIRVLVEKYVDGKPVGEQPAIVFVTLQASNGSWLVANYRFNE